MRILSGWPGVGFVGWRSNPRNAKLRFLILGEAMLRP